MEIGLVGLGKMGGNMRTRLRNGGHTVVGYDRNPDVSDVASLEELVEKLPSPRVVWVMVPHGEPTRETVRALGGLLDEGDLVVDGGNSRWTDDQVNADLLAERGVGFVDCGVSGGVWGLENGFELLEKVDLVENVSEVFDSWREGTVIRSWLLDLLVEALKDDSHLDKIAGYEEDSGEGRWTIEAAIDHAVPLPAITASL